MGWFLVTVVIPLVAPIILLSVFWLFPLPPPMAAQVQLLAPIKDGQLCWGAMGFCVSALYEIAEPGLPDHALAHGLVGWANGGFIAILVFSALLASGGAVFTTPLNVPAGVSWQRHYATLLLSSGLTLLAALGYTVVHFSLNGTF